MVEALAGATIPAAIFCCGVCVLEDTWQRSTSVRCALVLECPACSTL